MRSTTLFLMVVSLLITANLVWTCWRGNDGYYEAANKYCDKPCSTNDQCGWPCPWCKYHQYWKKKLCRK
ncbi:secreted protein with basic tail [Ixodes scapularis]|uniref:Secreted protein with basic tail n=1 Tax=Ixodes scapularis TaxID=6945 RepID=Q4PME6_IXOSC|nr:putative secreted protein with basic tail [Ixodes scapularis]EEC09249.1 secreted protein with basic tail [Ixodes scapularis]|eukprot:XP_002400298.1 secreted protein with basic tail [Ixodes scapularis]